MNKKAAFHRMADSLPFRFWCLQQAIDREAVEREVDRQMKQGVKVEIFDGDTWVEQ